MTKGAEVTVYLEVETADEYDDVIARIREVLGDRVWTLGAPTWAGMKELTEAG